MRQETALDILKAGRNVYLTGPAGSGKTHVLRDYITYLKDRGVSVALTAATGIAATHFGGVTIHSWSGIGIRDHLSLHDIDLLTQKEHLHKRYAKTNILIIDEVSMLSAALFDSLNALAKAMKGTDAPFGGMQVVLSGDFFQLPPIAKPGEQTQFIVASPAWQEMDIRVCYLEEQYRQIDHNLGQILADIRNGEVEQASYELLTEQIDRELADDVTPTRLYTHNQDVDELNQYMIEQLDGTKRSFEIKTSGRAQLVEGLVRGMLAPPLLELKEEAIVMFVKNNFDLGYVNGTLGVVEGFDEGKPVVRTFAGESITVAEAEWSVEDDGKVVAQATQLPLRLAWAITVHKSQGMTLDAAEIDLSKAFVPGQGYVALSRLRTLDGLLLRGLNNTALSIAPEALFLDERLRRESDKWQAVVSRFSSSEMKKMHDEFIISAGGTIDPKEIAKNQAKAAEALQPKKASHEITYDLLLEGYNPKQIAERRGMTLGTIIGHVEKLCELKMDLDLSSFAPDPATMTAIEKAFKAARSRKLTLVHRKLKGKYSFEELRLARLFLS